MIANLKKMIDLNKKTMAENITRTVIPSLPFDMFM